MDSKELKALVSLLDDEDSEVLSHVEKKIVSLGEEVIPFLEQYWEENFNPIVQRRLEDLIHTLQYDLLKSRLHDYKESGGEDLLEGMWLVATYQYPELSLQQLRQDLEQIYYDAWLEYKSDLHPIDQVKLLNSVLFSKLRFAANTRNFHSPANSFINNILETKKGNPIALCVVYMLVAQKLKMPVFGVNLPNLFILTYKTDQVQFYINAFNRGLIFSKNDIDNYIGHLHLTPEEEYYQPCSNLTIIKRVIRNLIAAYEKIGDHEKVEEVRMLLYTISDPGDPKF
ncbi:transglutaminase-like domain-containing protein [Nafulsella turpanensis]|uniref:transglutaminase-like domain-containing protein n=1 Tax=Nafulsella turpanensis TaxID=1265690 RepID=UPI0003450F53|nr:transglutaminase-like domain-containing protein [Nafulsella turpanensis]